MGTKSGALKLHQRQIRRLDWRSMTTSNRRGLFYFLPRAGRRESVIEYVIAHPAARGDPFRFVEGPMNAKINPALAVLFLRLRQIGETARPIWAEISVVVAGLPVEFVGNER